MSGYSTISLELAGENTHNFTYYYTKIDLPAKSHEIVDALQKVRIYDETKTPPIISVTACKLLPQLVTKRILATIDEMNFLAHRLASLDECEIIVLQAIAPKYLHSANSYLDVWRVINLTYDLDLVPVAVNIENDMQLGKLVIDDELNDDVNAVPDSSRYLLDIMRIGELQRKKDDGVFVGNMYIVAGQYELPSINDELCVPRYLDDEAYVFRLLIANASVGEDDVTRPCEWITLPILKQEANRIAFTLGETQIEDCAYCGFISCVPQIKEEAFGDMMKFDELNRLATLIMNMPSNATVTFKAVLDAEGCDCLSKAIDIAEHLEEYQIEVNINETDDFLKNYIIHHADIQLDERWINTILVGNNGDTLLERLGASLTDYGVVSARGRSLYELVSYDEPKLSEREPWELECRKMDEDFEMTM